MRYISRYFVTNLFSSSVVQIFNEQTKTKNSFPKHSIYHERAEGEKRKIMLGKSFMFKGRMSE